MGCRGEELLFARVEDDDDDDDDALEDRAGREKGEETNPYEHYLF